MDDDRMPRVGGDGEVSPLEKLRQLVRLNPAEGEFLRQQKKGKSALKVIALIEGRHQIYGLNAQRLSEFWGWLRQRENTALAQTSVENLRSMFEGDQLTPEGMHQWLVDLLQSTGMEKKNLKLLVLVTQEIRKMIVVKNAKEKWQADQYDKRQAGLAAVFEEIKHNPTAVELYEKIISVLQAKETK